jgi:hypothetical protein
MKNAQVFNDGSHLCGNFCMGNSTVSTKRRNEGISGVFISCFNRIGIKYFDGGTVVYLGDVLCNQPPAGRRTGRGFYFFYYLF